MGHRKATHQAAQSNIELEAISPIDFGEATSIAYQPARKVRQGQNVVFCTGLLHISPPCPDPGVGLLCNRNDLPGGCGMASPQTLST